MLPEGHPQRMSARLGGAIAAVREGRLEDAASVLDEVQEDEERWLAEAIPARRRPLFRTCHSHAHPALCRNRMRGGVLPGAL